MRFFQFIFFVAVFFAQMFCAEAVPEKRVLFIASYHPAFPSFPDQQRGLHDVLDPGGIYFDTECMDSKRFTDAAAEERFYEHLSWKLQALPPYDLVLAGDDNALNFVQKYRRSLFPNLPVVFFGLNDVALARKLESEAWVTGVIEDISVRETLALIPRLHPRVNEVVLITDPTTSGQSILSRLTRGSPRADRVKLRTFDLSHLTYDDLAARLERLNENQAVLLLSGYRDRAGNTQEFSQLLHLLNTHADRPLYHLWGYGVGKGLVGGKVVSHYAEAAQAAERVVRILDGVSPDQIPIGMRSPNQYVFDYLQLKRFGVDLAALPSDAQIINESISVEERHRRDMSHAVMVIVALGLAAALFLASTYRYAWMLAQIRRQQAALEQSRDGVLICSKRGTVEYCNQAWARMHGYEVAELKKVHLSQFHEPQFYQHKVYPFQETVMERGGGQMTFEHRRKDGSQFLGHVSATMVQLGTKFPKKMVIIMQDITEELRLQEQLSERQKMDSIGLLAGGLAHDLNNLLTPIMGYAELLGERHIDDEKSLRHAQHILQAAERAKSLILQVLAFSRKEPLTMSVIDLPDMLGCMKSMLTPLLPEGVTLQERVSEPSCCVVGDRQRLERVLMNLIVNARDAMEGGGEICVGIEPVNWSEPVSFAEVTLEPGEYICLSVADQGCGIDEQTRKHLFEPFFTTKPVGKGNGLGLAVIDGIVKQHGGAIEVISSAGHGAEFRLYFKRKNPDEAVAAREQAAPLKRDKLVVVVEDNTVELDAMISLLRGDGYSVEGFACPESALKWSRHAPCRVDLLLTEVVTATLDGPDLFDQMSRIFPDLKALFLSSYSATILSSALAVEHSVDIMNKPFASEELLRKVRSVLEEG